MEQIRSSSIYWRRRPIDSLTTDELRTALGEAICGLVDRSGRTERGDPFMLGLTTGLAVGGIAGIAATALLALMV